MANVMFKRGTQAALDTLIKSSTTNKYTDGAFYLTTDTDRLYVAQSATELVELNKSITTVDAVANLPASGVADGQFYYAVAENILCVYKETGVTGAPKWVQINPDTVDGNDYVSGFSITRSSVNSDGDLVYDWSMTQANKEGTAVAAHALTGSFTIKKTDIATLGGIAVDVDATSGGTNKAVVAIGGSGADTSASAGKVTIAGGDNVGVSVSGNTVTIKADDTTYGLSSAANSTSVALADGDGVSAGSVDLKADGTYITADGTTAGEVKFSHATQSGVSGTYGNTGADIAHENGSIVIPKITVDGAGHITSVSNQTFNMPTDEDTTYTVKAATAGTGATDSGKLTITINDGDSDISATSGQILYNKITVDGTENTVYNTQSLGSFYSASKVDEKLNAVDAMTYKGTVGATTPASTVTTLPTSGVKIGDTYKVSKKGTYASTEAEVGDLFIATGTETNGVITSGLAWTYIPSGADADTTYTLSAANNNITITDSVNSSAQNVALADDDVVTLTSTGNTITAAHADVLGSSKAGSYGVAGSDTSITMAYGGSINIPRLVVTAEGHISGIENVAVTLPSSDDTTYILTGTNSTNTIDLRNNEGTSAGSVQFAAGTATTVAMTGTEASDDTTKESKVVTIGHANVTSTPATTTPDQLAAAGTFTAINSVTVNSQGHVTGYNTATYTLPSEIETEAVATAASNKLAVKYNDSQIGSIQIQSNNLSVSSTATNDNLVTTIDMVWGSF